MQTEPSSRYAILFSLQIFQEPKRASQVEQVLTAYSKCIKVRGRRRRLGASSVQAWPVLVGRRLLSPGSALWAGSLRRVVARREAR